jgi:hypothetical protein
MSTRKIKDAKDLNTGELIYFKGHARATFLSDGRNIEEAIANKMDKVELAKVATSGSYEDLENKPTIPAAVTESTVSGWGFTKNSGTYSKPSDGIPASDLDSDVQTLLGKADTALQSIPSEYVTKTDLKDYYSKDNVSSIPFVSYEEQALTDVQKEQARKNIGADGMPMVEHGTSDTTFALTPNIFHVWDAVASLSLTLGSEKSGVVNEFLFQFASGATATTLSLPSSIKWTKELEIEPNKIYQISILKGLASVLSWEA